MINYSREVLYELEEQLQIISFDYDNPFTMCDKSLETIVVHLQQLKTYVLNNQFENQEEEIYFFKIIKPKFTSKLLYFDKIRKLESRKPIGSKKSQIEYFNSELNKLNVFFNENLEFYNYYRLGSIFLDDKIFIRNNVVIDYNLETFYYEKDPRFSTSHDFKIATILANEIFQKFIENKITVLTTRIPVKIKPQIVLPTLKWTESKSALIELIYALQSTKAFNNGNADIVEIAKCFAIVFDINLDDVYQVSNEIKNRKINITKFLDLLKENLRKKFEE